MQVYVKHELMGSIKCVEVGAENTGIAGTAVAATALGACCHPPLCLRSALCCVGWQYSNGNSIPDA